MLRLALTTSCLFAALLLAPLSAQGVGGHKGGSGTPAPKPPPTYNGPGDTTPPGGPKEETPEAPAPTGPVYLPIAPPIQAVMPETLPLVASGTTQRTAAPITQDPTEWLVWWRFQRWQRLEKGGAPPPAAPVAITPSGEPTSSEVQAADAGAEVDRAILEILLEAWEAAPENQQLRASLALALARAGQGSEISTLLRLALQDEDQRVIEAATLGLGVLREPHGIPLLAGLVTDSEEGRRALARSRVPIRTQAYAAFALGLIGQESRYEELRRTIREPLLQALRAHSATQDVHTACILALGLFPAEDAQRIVPELMRVLRDKRREEGVRGQVPIAVGKLLNKLDRMSALERSSFQELRSRLLAGSESNLVRQGCALAVGRMGHSPHLADPAAKALIEAYHKDSDPRVRHLAAIGLAEIGASGHPPGQTLALPTLMEGLEKGTDIDRSWSALALGWSAALAHDAGRSLPPLVAKRLLEVYPESGYTRLRAAVSLAMGLAGFSAGEDTIVAGMPSIGSPTLRAEALAGIALLGGKSLRDVVLDELDTIDPLIEAYQTVCVAIGTRDPDALFEKLAPTLERTGTRLQARYSASLALGWLRDPRAVDLLADLLQEDGPYFVQVAAANSLGRMAEPDRARWNAAYLDLLNPYNAPVTLVGSVGLPGVSDHL